MAACDVPRRQELHHHIKEHLRDPRQATDPQGKPLDSYRAFAPCHDDRSRSLSISVGEKQRIIYQCFAGCHALAVRAALIRDGVDEGCLPVPRAVTEELVDQLQVLYGKDLPGSEIRWRTFSLINGFGGEKPPPGRYPGGLRRFARDAGISHSDLYPGSSRRPRKASPPRGSTR